MVALSGKRHHRVNRWYKAVFLRSLEWACKNVMIIMKESGTAWGGKGELSTRLVKRDIIAHLIDCADKEDGKSRGPRLAPPPDEQSRFHDTPPCHRRFTAEPHRPLHVANRRYCVCHRSGWTGGGGGKRHRTRWICGTCRVPLCLYGGSECYERFYTRREYCLNPPATQTTQRKFLCDHMELEGSSSTPQWVV